MNILEQLRSDMDSAGTEAWVMEENTTDACLAVFDEFSAAHEVVELGEHQDRDGSGMYYASSKDPEYDDLSRWQGKRVRTVVALLPRPEPAPTLLAAAEAYVSWVDRHNASGDETLRGIRDAIVVAIKKARER